MERLALLNLFLLHYSDIGVKDKTQLVAMTKNLTIDMERLPLLNLIPSCSICQTSGWNILVALTQISMALMEFE